MALTGAALSCRDIAASREILTFGLKTRGWRSNQATVRVSDCRRKKTSRFWSAGFFMRNGLGQGIDIHNG
jgi:hypothetical protein